MGQSEIDMLGLAKNRKYVCYALKKQEMTRICCKKLNSSDLMQIYKERHNFCLLLMDLTQKCKQDILTKINKLLRSTYKDR